MKIERRFEPDPEALDRVAEILYRLLVDGPKDPVGSPTESQNSTCLSPENE
jgi:hypothetical protein